MALTFRMNLLLLLMLLLKLLHFKLHLLEDGLVLCTVSLQLLVLNPVYVVDDHLLLGVHDFLCVHARLRWMAHLLQVHFLANWGARSFCFGADWAMVGVHVRCGLTLRSACDGNRWL